MRKVINEIKTVRNRILNKEHEEDEHTIVLKTDNGRYEIVASKENANHLEWAVEQMRDEDE